MIRLEFSLSPEDMTPEQRAAAEQGAMDPEIVHFQYICQTTDGGHDPNGTPDDKVRDSHRALHGTVWRLDDPTAPIPPIGYGCRCGMRLVGKPKTIAEEVLGAAATSDPTSIPEAFGTFLDGAVPNWKSYAKKAAGLKPMDREGAIFLALKASEITGNLRELARMIVAANA